jgi:hypothetical protein
MGESVSAPGQWSPLQLLDALMTLLAPVVDEIGVITVLFV